MKIINGNKEIIKNLKKNTSVTIGNFDGVHKGHQKIILKCKELSKKNKLNSVVVSFDPHPRKFFNKKCKPFELTSNETKIVEINKLNVDYLVFLKFNRFLSKLKPIEFIEKILIKNLKAKIIVVGYNFHFGYQRKGNVNLLKKYSKKYNYDLIIVKPIIAKNGLKYNSSRIRQKLSFGKITKVKEMLGRDWQIIGKIIKGKRRGKEIGYPTANIKLNHYVVPLKGVYLTETYLEGNKKKYLGIANIGNRPTFGEKKVIFENHFFDNRRIIYGKKIYTNLLGFLRQEKRFSSTEQLKKQIELDIQAAKKFFKRK